ncbi:hypothetical protein P9112_002939 [Eukaryota sp. TZLM1-RC]
MSDCFKQLAAADVDDVPQVTEACVTFLLSNKHLLSSDNPSKLTEELLQSSNSAIVLRGLDVLFTVLRRLAKDHLDLVNSVSSNFNLLSYIENLLNTGDVLSKLALLETFASFLDDRNIALSIIHTPSITAVIGKIKEIGNECTKSTDYEASFMLNAVISFSSHLVHFPTSIISQFIPLLRVGLRLDADCLVVTIGAVGKLLTHPDSRHLLLNDKPASSSLPVHVAIHALPPSNKSVSSPTSIAAKHAMGAALIAESRQPSTTSSLVAFEHAARRISSPYPNAIYDQCKRSSGDVDCMQAALNLTRGACSLGRGLQGMSRVGGFLEWITSDDRFLSTQVAHERFAVLEAINNTETLLREKGQGLLSDSSIVEIKTKLRLGPFGGAAEYAVAVGEEVAG